MSEAEVENWLKSDTVQCQIHAIHSGKVYLLSYIATMVPVVNVKMDL